MHPWFYRIALSATAAVTAAGLVLRSDLLQTVAGVMAITVFVIWLGDK